MTPLHEAQTAMQKLLAEQGSCSPLELLLATNRLGYDDYQAWRRGECETLDGKLRGDIPGLMRGVEKWARSLNLEVQEASLYGVDNNAGTVLTASKEPRLAGFLHSDFLPLAGRAQLDLFLDSSESAATSDVVGALAMRDAQSSSSRLQALAAINPQHWAIADATVLIDALRSSSPCPCEEAKERLALLERRWLPAACALLHGGARDFLAPMWRDLGRALEAPQGEDAAGAPPFDALAPHQHPAWAYHNGLEWSSVKRSVEATPEFRAQPLLLGWLAEAEWRLNGRGAALNCWFDLCWNHPHHFEELVTASGFPDALVKASWLQAQREELSPPISPPWFPAWLAATQPDVAAGLPKSGAEDDPQRAFDLLLALALGGSDRQTIDSGAALQALHPGLLGRYLGSAES